MRTLLRRWCYFYKNTHMKISIILPTLGRSHYAEQLIEQIQLQKLTGIHEYQIIHLRWPEWVNWKWNEWAKIAEWEILWFLNDDIVIPVWLCEELLKWLGNAKISCPYTTIGRDKFCLPMNKKVGNIAGWCFMMRKSDYAPIPDELDLWYGDDWLYHKMWESVYYWGICHHYESKTINRPDLKEQIQERIRKDAQNWDIIYTNNFKYART